METVQAILDTFRSLTLHEWVLGTILVMSGRREVERQENGMRRAASANTWWRHEKLSRWSNWVWGWSLVGLGLGFVWHPLFHIAAVFAGITRFALLPAPCSNPLFNRPGFFRIARNTFQFILGVGCFVYGFGPLFR